jgi:Mg2+ and Co2+ transporter CorA
VLRATEWTESLRDLVSTILETNLTIQGNRLNTITKKVTSWAAIIAVPTAVTGYYGMNVRYTPGSPSTRGLSPRWCCWWSCPAACTSSSNAWTGSELGSLL